MANIIKTTLEDANDVLTYNNRASFPSSGERGKLYIAADTKYTYFWNGSSYVETRGSGYASSGHTHDDRYYTESEINTKLNNINKSKYLISPSDVLANANISDKENTNKAKLRVDLATSSMTTNKPVDDGFIYTNVWDINNSKNNNSQLYIPNGYHITNGRRLSVRGCKDNTWQTTWKELAYMSDLDNYVPEKNMLKDNTNLNTVITSGFYRLQAISPYINGMDVSFGQMIVCQGGADTIVQLVFPYTSSKMLIRTGYPVNNPGGKWNDWKTVALTDEIPTKISQLTNDSGFLASHLYRPIQVNGTQILANNSSSALNLKTGSNIRITNSNGTVTIDAANTTYSAGTGLSLSGTTFSVKTGYTTNANNRNYKVAADSNGNLYVNVPWSSSGTLDASLNSSSTNALQNKAIYSAFSSAVGYDNNYYAYGAQGSWRIRQYNATGNSLDIRYGVIAINSQSTNYSVSFGNGKKFTSTNYIVVFGLYRSNTQSWFWSPIVQSKTESGFTVFLRGNSSGDNSGTIMYLAIRSN